jgi:hypothetical protein
MTLLFRFGLEWLLLFSLFLGPLQSKEIQKGRGGWGGGVGLRRVERRE